MPLIGLILQLIGFICISLTYALHTSPYQAKSSWFAVCVYIYPASEVSTWQEKNTPTATAFTLIPFHRWRLNCHSDRFPRLAPWNEYLMSFILHVTNTKSCGVFFFVCLLFFFKYTQEENELIQIISDPCCVCLTKNLELWELSRAKIANYVPDPANLKARLIVLRSHNLCREQLAYAEGLFFFLLLPQAWPPVGRRQWLHKKKRFS